MEFVKAIKIHNRMCDTYSANSDCESCPLLDVKTKGTGDECDDIMWNYPELAEPVLEKWDKEHPAIRNADKLREIFPNANTQLKRICPQWLGCKAPFVDGCDAGPCSECREEFWNAEYKEVKENE